MVAICNYSPQHVVCNELWCWQFCIAVCGGHDLCLTFEPSPAAKNQPFVLPVLHGQRYCTHSSFDFMLVYAYFHVGICRHFAYLVVCPHIWMDVRMDIMLTMGVARYISVVIWFVMHRSTLGMTIVRLSLHDSTRCYRHRNDCSNLHLLTKLF